MPRTRSELSHRPPLPFLREVVAWGTILRLIRVDLEPHAQDCRGQSEHVAQGYMLNESACHTECLRKVLRPEVPLTFHRHWTGGTPMLDDSDDIDGKPCAMCARAIAPADLVRLRVQKPLGPVKRLEFDELSLPLHFDCLASVSTSRVF